MKKNIVIGLGILSFFLLAMAPHSAYAFGEKWTWKSCPKCKEYYRHMGNDIPATPGHKVFFKKEGYFKAKLSQGDWKYGVVIRDKSNSKTWVIWHLGSVVNFKEGDKVKDKQIGTVANLTVTSDHVHLGLRKAPYHSSLSWKGALPACNHKPEGLPKAPEKFGSPNNGDIEIKKK